MEPRDTTCCGCGRTVFIRHGALFCDPCKDEMALRTCKRCAEKFTPDHEDERYCSRLCSDEYPEGKALRI